MDNKDIVKTLRYIKFLNIYINNITNNITHTNLI